MPLFYCGHICEPAGCTTRSGNLLWERRRLKLHVKEKTHKTCVEECPGYRSIDDTLVKLFIEGSSEPIRLKTWMKAEHGYTAHVTNPIDSTFKPLPTSCVALHDKRSIKPKPALPGRAGDDEKFSSLFYHPYKHYRPNTFHPPTPNYANTSDPDPSRPNPDTRIAPPYSAYYYPYVPQLPVSTPLVQYETESRPDRTESLRIETETTSQAIRVLFIPDPTRSVQSNARDDTAVTKAKAKDLILCGKDMPNYAIRKISNTHWIQEWAWMLTLDSSLKTSKLNVTMMHYDDFFRHMSEEDEGVLGLWAKDLNQFDVLIGIPDKSLNYFNSDYKLSSANVDLYNRNLGIVKSLILIWPDPSQIEIFGRKDILIKNLDEISRVMGTHRPSTTVLKRGEKIPAGTVLKRTHSDSSHHMILPDSQIRTWINMDKGPPDAVWISQEYVPGLRDIGEWRVIIVNKTIQYVIHSIPKNGVQMSRVVRGYYTLEELSNFHKQNENPTQLELVDPEGSSKTFRNNAEAEFRKFVMEIFERLRAKEVDETHLPSSLDVFCRIDVSVIFDGEDRAHYFVNEVERTNTASLWTNLLKFGSVTMANDLAIGLDNWVRANRQ